ncbi:MAG: DUF1045 domain-containing protein [Neomegalonema sp.]|nr:DUF1045 domain-containing protein [Neomegalonema sp.]
MSSAPLAAGFARYAVYFAPERGSALAELANAWLGWDPQSGIETAAPALDPLLAKERTRLIRTATRYGFHATIKAPFRLAEGVDAAALDAAVTAFAAAQARFEIPALSVQSLHGFLALRPAAPCAPLDALAARTVEALNPLGAPLSEAELARRRQSRLSERQDALMLRWGYPYVFEEFNFHMTLTERLADAELAVIQTALAELFAPALAAPVPVEALCVFGDPGAGERFRLLKRYALQG